MLNVCTNRRANAFNIQYIYYYSPCTIELIRTAQAHAHQCYAIANERGNDTHQSWINKRLAPWSLCSSRAGVQSADSLCPVCSVVSVAFVWNARSCNLQAKCISTQTQTQLLSSLELSVELSACVRFLLRGRNHRSHPSHSRRMRCCCELWVRFHFQYESASCAEYVRGSVCSIYAFWFFGFY